jgi:hypothetical protein
MTYSKEDAIMLIRFYSGKIIGKKIEDSFPLKITHLALEIDEDGQYSVKAACLRKQDIFWMDISDSAKRLNLPLPEDVLQEK